jgi:hypothetical protein
VPRNALVHHASLFFAGSRHATNPLFAGSRSQKHFFPQSFLTWGANVFGTVNKGRLIHATGSWSMTRPEGVIDIPPDDAHERLIVMHSRTTEVVKDNELRRARYEALERQHDALIAKYTQVEMELIEVRCQASRHK